MGKKRMSEGKQMNLLFTMVLFLLFVLCALFTVLFGSRVYENIGSRGEKEDVGKIPLHYIANKIRQGDRINSINVIEKEGIPVLELVQKEGEISYYTWIYYRDGSVRELFTREGTGLGLEDGLEITSCSGLSISKKGRLIELETLGEGGGKLTLSVRSGGNGNE